MQTSKVIRDLESLIRKLYHDHIPQTRYEHRIAAMCRQRAAEPYSERHAMSQETQDTLYSRLGGYDAIAAVADDLVGRLQADERLGRFWQHRGADGMRREKQLLIDFLCANAGGNLLYTGRDMATTHRGMKIDESDWQCFLGHLRATLDSFSVGPQEQADVLAFIDSTKGDVVD